MYINAGKELLQKEYLLHLYTTLLKGMRKTIHSNSDTAKQNAKAENERRKGGEKR